MESEEPRLPAVRCIVWVDGWVSMFAVISDRQESLAMVVKYYGVYAIMSHIRHAEVNACVASKRDEPSAPLVAYDMQLPQRNRTCEIRSKPFESAI